jgi:tripartite-type tricarboxylate transporter receptor subunit TctC
VGQGGQILWCQSGLIRGNHFGSWAADPVVGRDGSFTPISGHKKGKAARQRGPQAVASSSANTENLRSFIEKFHHELIEAPFMKPRHRRQLLHLAAGAAALPAVSRIAWAQAYPARPITIVVPFAVGGPNDTIARLLAEPMRAALGQPIIVENVVGAAGSIGVGRAVRASGDGYTLSMGSKSSHILNAAIYALPYDMLKDLEPVSLLAIEPFIILARNSLPARDLKEFIAYLKANPDKASQGNPGAGSTSHVTGAFFQIETGTHFQFVPYRGAAPALQDLVAGQIDLTFDTPSNCLAQVRAGSVKAYAIAAKARLAVVPEIPTVDEAGLPGFYSSVWYALWAPKGTPKQVIAKLNAAVVEAMRTAAVSQRFAEIGLDVFPREQQTPQALAAFQKAEIDKWWPVVKAAKIMGE